MSEILPSSPPRKADDVITIDDRPHRVLAVIPFTSGNGYRVPVREIPASPQPEAEEPETAAEPRDDETSPPAYDLMDFESPVLTLLYPKDSDPLILQHPHDWQHTSGIHAPLAVEIRQGDILDPARGKPGRPNEHREDADIRSAQVVLSAVYDPADGRIAIQTRDAQGQLRRYRRYPEEAVDFTRDYRPPPRLTPPRPTGIPAPHPQVFTGPYVSATGAQFILQERSKRGGRPSRNAPRFREEMQPLFDPTTGDLMPYIVLAPGRNDDVQLIQRPPTTFSETAKRLPEVRAILEDLGITTGETPS